MYRLGKRSQAELEGVHPQLGLMVRNAITITPVDFSVHDGIRDDEEQRELVRIGASRTMRSYHIPDIDRPRGIRTEFGQAVDLVPYINGKLRWEWEPIFHIAAAMHDSLHLIGPGKKIRWGAVWDKTLDELNPHQLAEEREAYIERRKAKGRRAFTDGPHFQIEVYY